MKSPIRSLVCLFAVLLAVLCGPVLLAQVGDLASDAGVIDSATPVPSSLLTVTVVWAFVSSSVLEWLKRKSWFTLISERTAWGAQRVIGILVAIAGAIGVSWSFDGAAGVLTVTGLQIASMTTLAGEALRQWVVQEVLYRTSIRPYRPGEPSPLSTRY